MELYPRTRQTAMANCTLADHLVHHKRVSVVSTSFLYSRPNMMIQQTLLNSVGASQIKLSKQRQWEGAIQLPSSSSWGGGVFSNPNCPAETVGMMITLAIISCGTHCHLRPRHQHEQCRGCGAGVLHCNKKTIMTTNVHTVTNIDSNSLFRFLPRLPEKAWWHHIQATKTSICRSRSTTVLCQLPANEMYPQLQQQEHPKKVEYWFHCPFVFW